MRRHGEYAKAKFVVAFPYKWIQYCQPLPGTIAPLFSPERAIKFHFLTKALAAILLGTGCLLLPVESVTGAHAQIPESANVGAPASAPVSAAAPEPAAVPPGDTTLATSADVASTPARAVRNSSSAQRERELLRAHRLERHAIISESTGIPLDELNNLLRKLQPSAEERSEERRRVQTGRLAIDAAIDLAGETP